MKHQTTSESSWMLRVVPPSSSGAVDTATLELLLKWKQEDATENPEEVRAVERGLSEFKKAMDESRAEAGEPVLYP
jgi:hypothetical protein